jgi:hypothetical protein
MTCGGLGALSIYLWLSGEQWKSENRIKKGCGWIADHFTVTENPENNGWYYYFLYSLERAGALVGTETFGKHEWYAEGANQLLKAQRDDGAWGSIEDTCFAILFLRRSTKPLKPIETGGGKK